MLQSLTPKVLRIIIQSTKIYELEYVKGSKKNANLGLKVDRK